MQKRLVIKTMSLSSGFITLTPAQARVRIRNLKPVDADDPENHIYEITNPVEFKVGEVIGMDPEQSDRYVETHTEALEDETPAPGGDGSAAPDDVVTPEKAPEPLPKVAVSEGDREEKPDLNKKAKGKK